MPEPEVHIILNPDGTTSVEVINVKGPSCAELSKTYTDLFHTTKEVKKVEYQQQSVSAKQRQRH